MSAKLWPLFSELLEQNLNGTTTSDMSVLVQYSLLRRATTADIECISTHLHTVMNNKAESILCVVPHSVTRFVCHVVITADAA